MPSPSFFSERAILDRDVAGDLKADAVARIISHDAVADRDVLALEQIDAAAAAAVERLGLAAIAVDGQALHRCVLDVPPADDRKRQFRRGLPRDQVVEVERRRKLKDIRTDLPRQRGRRDFKTAARRSILDGDAVADAKTGWVGHGDLPLVGVAVGRQRRGKTIARHQDRLARHANDIHVVAQPQGVAHLVAARADSHRSPAELRHIVHGRLQCPLVVALQVAAADSYADFSPLDRLCLLVFSPSSDGNMSQQAESDH